MTRAFAYDPHASDEARDEEAAGAVWDELLHHDVAGEYDDAPANDARPTPAEYADGADEWAGAEELDAMRAERVELDRRRARLTPADRRAVWYLRAEGTLAARAEVARSRAATANDNAQAGWYAREAARLTERAAEMRAARVAAGGWVSLGVVLR